ncbi:hypothetical protein KEJ27_08495 [Candidatus Bathyarchaeota archaeon]|nr:hypothetical protein [Candidatus Bathyarchaeota archaeon]MBS7614046.1 hypothetical protein [Candidatus Bathyarchaeota archaeon]MBS7618572.1 hypothetical protein [Candidatus Bathyarchaeota archaeon]
MSMEEISRTVKEIKTLIENLQCRVEALEKAVKASSVIVEVEVPKVILEKKTLDIRIGEDELLGRIILLVKEGFFNEERTANEVADELIRRCWHPKDLKHIRPSLEQLVVLGILERSKIRRKKGRGFKWVYSKNKALNLAE